MAFGPALISVHVTCHIDFGHMCLMVYSKFWSKNGLKVENVDPNSVCPMSHRKWTECQNVTTMSQVTAPDELIEIVQYSSTWILTHMMSTFQVTEKNCCIPAFIFSRWQLHESFSFRLSKLKSSFGMEASRHRKAFDVKNANCFVQKITVALASVWSRNRRLYMCSKTWTPR